MSDSFTVWSADNPEGYIDFDQVAHENDCCTIHRRITFYPSGEVEAILTFVDQDGYDTVLDSKYLTPYEAARLIAESQV